MPIYFYHIIAFVAGFIIDAILGDPYSFPHPVKVIGNLIAKLDKHYLGEKVKQNTSLENETQVEAMDETKGRIEALRKRAKGRRCVLIVTLLTLSVTSLIYITSYAIHPIVGCVVETIMTYQILAAKCLYVESMKVYKALKKGPLEDARRAVSMIVGRDTDKLDETGVAKAAIETVAENASDGVIAPQLYLAIGGPILGMLYKAINTMDSMIGYKNDRYMDFGRFAAKLDDVANYIPARICSHLMIFSCLFLGKGYSASGARKIYKRDRYKHSSPNSAHPESVCAGALGIRLAGDASYFGKMVSKPTIGDDTRPVEVEDIRRSNHLMYGAAILCELICVGFMLAGALMMVFAFSI